MLASAGIALAALLCLAALAVLLATATGARADDEPDDEPDITHYDQLPPDRAWRDSIRLRSVRGYDGEDVTVAVIDTGITHHPDVDELEARVDLMPDGDGYDRYGHGTHIAGVIAGDGEASDGRWAGVAPEASILPIRVADWNGATDVSAALVAREPARHGRRRGRLGVGGGVVDRDRRLERCRRSGVRRDRAGDRDRRALPARPALPQRARRLLAGGGDLDRLAAARRAERAGDRRRLRRAGGRGARAPAARQGRVQRRAVHARDQRGARRVRSARLAARRRAGDLARGRRRDGDLPGRQHGSTSGFPTSTGWRSCASCGAAGRRCR